MSLYSDSTNMPLIEYVLSSTLLSRNDLIRSPVCHMLYPIVVIFHVETHATTHPCWQKRDQLTVTVLIIQLYEILI